MWFCGSSTTGAAYNHNILQQCIFLKNKLILPIKETTTFQKGFSANAAITIILNLQYQTIQNKVTANILINIFQN